MLTIKDDEVYDLRGELIGGFCQNKDVLVYIPESYRNYTVEELMSLVEHMLKIKNEQRSRAKQHV